jgi:hypothetical protein
MVALLDEVAALLQRKRTRGEVFVIGGGAMILAGYGNDRVSHDIDGMITAGHGAVVDAVRDVAKRHGLASSWLNEQATAYMPPVTDTAAVSVFHHPNLRVTAASAPYLLAMKLMADRPQDQLDSTVLARHLKLDRAGAAQVVATYYGEAAVTAEVLDAIADAIP